MQLCAAAWRKTVFAGQRIAADSIGYPGKSRQALRHCIIIMQFHIGKSRHLSHTINVRFLLADNGWPNTIQIIAIANYAGAMIMFFIFSVFSLGKNIASTTQNIQRANFIMRIIGW